MEANTVRQLDGFMRALSSAACEPLLDHASLDAWAVSHWREFWAFFLRWSRAALHIDGNEQPVCVNDHDIERAQFFPQLRLSYADALLSMEVAGGDAPALLACDAQGNSQRWTRGELRERVARLAAEFRDAGLAPGDRVGAVLRNDGDAVTVALAVTAVGATLATAAPDIGPDALRDRFVPVAPKWLVAHAKPMPFDAGVPLPDKLARLTAELPGLQVLIRIDGDAVTRGVRVAEMPLASFELRGQSAAAFEWPKFPFNHPLFIMFTSGTTGPPKCIVHGAGGTLLEHVKEHRLHSDLAPGDRLFFQTGCSWMMWNWQLSALASGAEIVCYSGPVASPATLWDIAARERVTVFGTSPPYLLMSQQARLVPREGRDFGALRAMMSTGSVLHDWQYAWVRDNVKDVPLWSISGGTDIIGCFVLGSPLLAVTPGESPCRSLAMDVRVLDGQLVCANPFPSRPVGFLNDADGSRFHTAYFAQNAGVWTHGDHAELTPRGGWRILGRFDGVLNVRGIKVSPGEICRVLLAQAGVRDALIVEQSQAGESRVIAAVVLKDGARLDAALVAHLRSEIARRLSNAHVPDLFIDVPALPVTHSGKTSEAAARRAVNGRAVENEAALRNPECLAAIRDHPMLRAPASPSLASADTRSRIAAIWAELFGMPQPIDEAANFFELGGNSLMAARLLARIAEATGRRLPVSAMLDASTVAQLVARVESASREGDASATVFEARAGTGRPVFLVHGLSGTVMECRALISQLRTERPVYGFQARGLDDGLPPFERVEDMAAAYVPAMREVQPHGPYTVWGFSFGGLVALEIARLLAEQGEPIEHVGLVDTYIRRSLHGAAAFVDVSRRAWRIARHMPLSDMPAWLRAKVHPAAEPALPPAQQAVRDAMEHALRVHAPGAFASAPVIYLRADLPLGGYADSLPAWRKTAGAQLRVMRVPGAHLDLVGPTSGYAAHAIDDALASACDGGATPPAGAPASARSAPRASGPGLASSR